MRKTEEEEWRTLLLLRLLLGSFHTQFFFYLIQEYRGRLSASRLVVGRCPTFSILPFFIYPRACFYPHVHSRPVFFFNQI